MSGKRIEQMPGESDAEWTVRQIAHAPNSRLTNLPEPILCEKCNQPIDLQQEPHFFQPPVAYWHARCLDGNADRRTIGLLCEAFRRLTDPNYPKLLLDLDLTEIRERAERYLAESDG